jgi:hypothetical protein
VTGLGDNEWGYISIDELIALKWRGIPRIEINAHFDEATFASDIKNYTPSRY